MKKIQILGTGCPKCKQLTANVTEAVSKLGIEAEIEKVTDINQITAFGVMMTPALVVDGKIVSAGKLLSVEEIILLLEAPAGESLSACKAEPASESKGESCGCGCASEKKTEAAAPCCCAQGGVQKVVRLILLAVVVASIAWILAKETGSVKPQVVAGETVAAKSDALFVYYFHGTRRCFTCNKIEAQTSQAIAENYAAQMASGDVVFKSVNIEEPDNEHFIEDFGLVSSTVAMKKGDKSERFDSVWDLVHNPVEFASYIKAGAARMLTKE